MEYRLRYHDGSYRWLLDCGNPIFGLNGEFLGYIGSCYDIDSSKQVHERLQQMSLLFQHSREALIITDAQIRITAVNQAFTDITGYGVEEVMHQNPSLLKSGLQEPLFYAMMWDRLKQVGFWQGEIWNRRKDGDTYLAWLRISAVRNEAGEVSNYLGMVADITEQRAAEKRVRELAYFDPLTGLPNRSLFTDRLNQALAHADRDNWSVAVIFIDLDHFKQINDSLGHQVGDGILRQVARRLRDNIRRSDTAARLGGDEFALVLPDAQDETVIDVVRKLSDALAHPYQIGEHQLAVTPSLGISLYPQDGQDGDTLVKHADMAMYQAKMAGRNGYQFFTAEMNVASFERQMLETSLRQALEQQEFRLLYQPLVDLKDGHIVGAEALLRWQHPQLGLVPPSRFIPVAEECGLIVSLGDWVLQEVCRQWQDWRDSGLDSRISVNVSSRQFQHRGFASRVGQILAEFEIPPGVIELEFREDTVMQKPALALETLRQLKQHGIKLALDGFGSGFSCLTRLQEMPIDRLKIHQDFVREVNRQQVGETSIAGTIVRMGHSFGLEVVAEGVETAEQLLRIQDESSDLAQGYHFSVPLPAERFTELLRYQPYHYDEPTWKTP
jgi:diguanylate cyclase (GGDEF)-like protein/PAS domain S-box-containing protein